MLIKKKSGIEIPSSQITPQHLYHSRRNFMKGATLSGVAALLAACAPGGSATNSSGPKFVESVGEPGEVSATMDELGNPINSFTDITTHNNYYEFSTTKIGPSKLSGNFPTSPWEVEVTGLVNNPKTYGMEDLLKFDQEERIYRLRCVEAWSMVIPWVGFPLSKILEEVDPKSEAKYVKFVTVNDPVNMPGLSTRGFPWPYEEGLRLDEAMHDLTLMATGMYGTELLPQNGAPVRLVVPWKYGFKSGKAIVKIELVESMPLSFWMIAAPAEYGFFANVHPEVPHPRWSQETERRIGQIGRERTLLLNGYADQVAHLYDDLTYDTNLDPTFGRQ